MRYEMWYTFRHTRSSVSSGWSPALPASVSWSRVHKQSHGLADRGSVFKLIRLHTKQNRGFITVDAFAERSVENAEWKKQCSMKKVPGTAREVLIYIFFPFRFLLSSIFSCFAVLSFSVEGKTKQSIVQNTQNKNLNNVLMHPTIIFCNMSYQQIISTTVCAMAEEKPFSCISFPEM